MNNFYNYLIEANLCLIVFGVVYLLLFRKETNFKFRRYYLVGAIFITLVAPLLHLSPMSGSDITGLSEIPTAILPELVIGNSSQEAAGTTNMLTYLNWGYWIVTVIIAQLFLFQIMQLAWFIFSKKTNIRKNDNIYIIYTNGTLPTFSFFNVLFFDNSVKLSSEEQAKVMYHEMIHINQVHSFDVVVFEIMKIIMWFNPMAWFVRKEIQDIHEYLADDKVIENTNPEQYTSLLAKMALNKAHLSLAHHFNKSKTLKRIEMMTKAKHDIKPWKTLLIIPILAITLFVVSCNDEVMQDVDTVMETASQTEMPEILRSTLAELQQKYPDADFAYLEADGTTEAALNNLQDIDPMSIAHVRVFKEKEKVGILVNKNGPIQNQPDINNVFTIVEEAAIPEGGYAAFYERIQKTLLYPVQAREMGIEGKVYVQFIIDESGQVTDVKVVKGIGAGCDMAALAAVEQGGSWSAPRQRGKAVKQRIILPITFKLGDGEAKKEAEG